MKSFLVKTPTNTTIVHEPSHHVEFHNALSQAARGSDNIKSSVHIYKPEEYAKMRTFLAPDKKSGFAIKSDGDIVSVFSTEKGRGDGIVPQAIKAGGKKLNAFDGYLPKFYARHGFREIRREKNWAPGQPDVVYMSLSPTAEDSSGLVKSKNVREQRKRVFGTKGDPGKKTKFGQKQIEALKELYRRRYGLEVAPSRGKIDPETGKRKGFDPKQVGGKLKPDWRSGDFESQINPQAVSHEAGHLEISPEGLTLPQIQEQMDQDYATAASKYKGAIKQTQYEIQPMAAENPIRRRAGVPAFARPQDTDPSWGGSSTPLSEESPPRISLDTKKPYAVRQKTPKGKLVDLIGLSSNLSPGNKARMQQVDIGALKFDPKLGWHKVSDPNALINLRAQGQQQEAQARAQERYAPKVPKKLAASELEKAPSVSEEYENMNWPHHPTEEGDYHRTTEHQQGINIHRYNIIDPASEYHTGTIYAITHNGHPNGNPIAKLQVEHINPETGEHDPYIGFALTDPLHRGKGYGTLLHQAAIKDYGKLKSDSRLSPGSQKIYEKLSQDPKFKTKLAPTKPTQNKQGITIFPQDTQHEVAYKPKKLAASELEKGIAQRKFPYKPSQVPDEDRADIHEWQSYGQEPAQDVDYYRDVQQVRDELPAMSPNARQRGLLKLHSRTKVRKNPKTGEREFLLHRGTLSHEYNDVMGENGQYSYNQRSSWTPDYGRAENFTDPAWHTQSLNEWNPDEGPETGPGKVISSWIPESKISHVPLMYGDSSVRSQGKGMNPYREELEVIVEPHTGQHMVGLDPIASANKPNPNIHERISGRKETGFYSPQHPKNILGYQRAVNAQKKLAVSELEKMSRPRLQFPNLGIEDETSNVQTVTTPRQRKIATHAVINEAQPTFATTASVPVSETKAFKRLKNQLFRPAGVNAHVNRDSPSLVSESRSKGKKDFTYASGGKYVTKEPWKKLSPERKIAHGRRIDMVQSHEAGHRVASKIAHRYGDEAKNKILHHLIEHAFPSTEDRDTIVRYVRHRGYLPQRGGFHEEVVNGIRDILVNPETREFFSKWYTSGPKGLYQPNNPNKGKDPKEMISKLKSGWNKLTQRASSLTDEDVQQILGNRTAKLAASEKKIIGKITTRGKKARGVEAHHDVPVAENIDWHLRNLWETPGSMGGYRTVREIPKEEHEKIHAKDKKSLRKIANPLSKAKYEADKSPEEKQAIRQHRQLPVQDLEPVNPPYSPQKSVESMPYPPHQSGESTEGISFPGARTREAKARITPPQQQLWELASRQAASAKMQTSPEKLNAFLAERAREEAKDFIKQKLASRFQHREKGTLREPNIPSSGETEDIELPTKKSEMHKAEKPPTKAGEKHPSKPWIARPHPVGLSWHSDRPTMKSHDQTIDDYSPGFIQKLPKEHQKLVSSMIQSVRKDPYRHYVLSYNGTDENDQKIRARHIKALLLKDPSAKLVVDSPDTLTLTMDRHNYPGHKTIWRYHKNGKLETVQKKEKEYQNIHDDGGDGYPIFQKGAAEAFQGNGNKRSMGFKPKRVFFTFDELRCSGLLPGYGGEDSSLRVSRDFMAKAELDEDQNSLLNRVEDKYLISREHLDLITTTLKEKLQEGDIDTSVRYNVNKTIYLDNQDMDSFRDNMEGVVPRFKVRIRQYAPNGTEWEDVAYIELKVKSADGMTRKIRVRIPADLIDHISEGGEIKPTDELVELNRDLQKQHLWKRIASINSVISKYGFKKQLLVVYNRRAYSNKNIRITIDDNIKYFEAKQLTPETLKLVEESSCWKKFYKKMLKAKEGDYLILEVKHEDGTPGWVKNLLEEVDADDVKFSKYSAAVVSYIKDGNKESGSVTRPRKMDPISIEELGKSEMNKSWSQKRMRSIHTPKTKEEAKASRDKAMQAAINALKEAQDKMKTPEMPKPQVPKDPLKKGPVRSPKKGHTIAQFERLKQDHWHNPDTGTEISEEEGQTHLHNMYQNKADKKVKQMISEQTKPKAKKPKENPGDWFGKGLKGDWQKEGYKISHQVGTNNMTKQPFIKVSAFAPNGERVGMASFERMNNKWIPAFSSVASAHQRKGIASAMYSHAEKQIGSSIIPSPHQSTSASQLWDQPNRPFGKSKEDKNLPPEQRKQFRKEKKAFAKDPLEAQVTTKPGVSQRGIEVRRGDSRVSGAVAHGYSRVKEPKQHMEQAKKLFGKAISLEHYSPLEGLSEINPSHQFSGTDASGKALNRKTAHPISFYYASGADPEHLVTSKAKSRYTIELPEGSKFYDMHKDPDKIIQGLRQASMNRQVNPGFVDQDEMHQAIKNAGYVGFHDSHNLPGVVALYHPQRVKQEQKMNKVVTGMGGLGLVLNDKSKETLKKTRT